jgi:hypothetical protein
MDGVREDKSMNPKFLAVRAIKRILNVLNEQLDELEYKAGDANLTTAKQSVKTAAIALEEWMEVDRSK